MKNKNTVTLLLGCLITLGMQAVLAQQNADIQVTTIQLGDNFYYLEGRGGKVGVIAGSEGVFLVDSQYANMTEKLVAAINELTDSPIKYLVNTHLHGDHTGGNENFANMGVTLFARRQLREGMADPVGERSPAPAAALSRITYDDVVTFHMNGELIELIPVRAAHTSGDTLIKFTHNNALMTGDYYRSVGYPNIDLANGGSLAGMIAGLGQTIGLCDADTRVIPSHGPVVTRVELQAHRDMLIDLKTKVQVLIDGGRTLNQVLVADVTADYDAIVPGSEQTKERIIRQIYAELSN